MEFDKASPRRSGGKPRVKSLKAESSEPMAMGEEVEGLEESLLRMMESMA